MAITRDQLIDLCTEEVDKLLDGKKVLNIHRGSVSFTLFIEGGRVATRTREKEIETEKK